MSTIYSMESIIAAAAAAAAVVNFPFTIPTFPPIGTIIVNIITITITQEKIPA